MNNSNNNKMNDNETNDNETNDNDTVSTSTSTSNDNDNDNEERYWLRETAFLHIGKAGGGAIRERIRHLGFKTMYKHGFDSMMKKPKGHKREKAMVYLMALRDPIDRFVSNFYWSGLLLCHDGPNNHLGEPRTKISMIPENMDRYCKKVGEKSTHRADIIHSRYHGNANELAMALCSEDPRVKEAAIEDIQDFSHARASINDWLGFYYKSRAKPDKPDKIPVGIVLEKGFDFEQQIDGAVEFALRHSLWKDEEERIRRRNTTQEKDTYTDIVTTQATWQATTQPEALLALRNDTRLAEEAHAIFQEKLASVQKLHDPKNDHTSHTADENEKNYPPWIKTMHVHQERGLTATSACCLAKHFYGEDYILLGLGDTDSEQNDTGVSPLAELVCKGPAASQCREALASIARRHADRNCPAVLEGLYPNPNQNQTSAPPPSKLPIVDGAVLEARSESFQISEGLAMASILLLGLFYGLYRGRSGSRAAAGTVAKRVTTATV